MHHSYLFKEFENSRLEHFIYFDKYGQPLAFATTSFLGSNTAQLEQFVRSKNSPVGTIEHLICSIIESFQKQGLENFNLGEVPFVNCKSNIFKEKIVNFVGKHFLRKYNCTGLYNFKSKFDPHWRPVYWASYPKLSLIELAEIAIITGASGLFVSKGRK